MFFKEKSSNNWGRNVYSKPKKIEPKNLFGLKNIIKKKAT